jgi:hypothetical protein
MTTCEYGRRSMIGRLRPDGMSLQSLKPRAACEIYRRRQGVTQAPDDPLLGMAAGAVVPAVGGAVASKAGKFVGSTVRPFAEDLPVVGKRFAGTRDQMVGERLLREADSPGTLDRTLSPGPPGDDLANTNVIPGSNATLGQLSGDVGILQAERQVRTADNADQNAVRVCALRDAARSLPPPVRERAEELARGVDPLDTLPLIEALIFGQVGNLPDVVPFKSWTSMAPVLTDQDNRKRAA